MSTSTAASSSNDDSENFITPAKPYSGKGESSPPTPFPFPSEPSAFQSEVMTALSNLASSQIPDKFERFCDGYWGGHVNPHRAGNLMLDIQQIVHDAQSVKRLMIPPQPSQTSLLAYILYKTFQTPPCFRTIPFRTFRHSQIIES